MNPNNITSQYYDLVSSPLKSPEVTDEEISLVNRLAAPGAEILDVGAGTGRHALPLSNQGFNVVAIDSSTEMLKILKENDLNKRIEVIDKSIYRYTPNKKFDLILLFWNSFNEIALSKKDANALLLILKSCLNHSGKIIINIDDASTIDPSNFNFSTNRVEGEYAYKMHWSTFRFLKKTNTSISKEVVEIYKNDKLIDTKTTFIKQRYWNMEQINLLATLNGLKIQKLKLKTSNEFYLILTLNK